MPGTPSHGTRRQRVQECGGRCIIDSHARGDCIASAAGAWRWALGRRRASVHGGIEQSRGDASARPAPAARERQRRSRQREGERHRPHREDGDGRTRAAGGRSTSCSRSRTRSVTDTISAARRARLDVTNLAKVFWPTDAHHEG